MNFKLSILFGLTALLPTNMLFAQAESEPPLAPNLPVLNDEQLKRLDTSVERGLEWLATQQKADGSFKSIETGQPAVTALCVMAFLAQGKTTSDREYGPVISKAIDFICAQQKRNGLLSAISPNAVPIPRGSVAQHEQLTPAIYNHAIGSLALAEAYGQCTGEQSKRVAGVVEKALSATLEIRSPR